jgi:hypothetical protein
MINRGDVMERTLCNTLRLLFLGVILGFTSCAADQAFVRAVDETWTVIGTEYTAYVEADPALDADSKRTRKRTAELLTITIREAQR